MADRKAPVRCPHCALETAPVCGECFTELPPSAFHDTVYAQAAQASSGRRPASTDTSPEARRRQLGLAREGDGHHMNLNQRISEAEKLVELTEAELADAAAELRTCAHSSPDLAEIEDGSGQSLTAARSRPDYAAWSEALAEHQRADKAHTEARNALNTLLDRWDQVARDFSLRQPPTRSAPWMRTEPDQDSYFWAD